MDQAHQLNMAKYEDLVEEARRNGYQAECIELEVGLWGLFIESELFQLRNALNASTKAITELASSLTRSTILGSFKIWCSKNVSNE